MKACVWADPNLSGAMHRIANALERWAPPEISITRRADEADLVVLHTIGTDVWPLIKEIRETGRAYAIMQYCLRSTQEPDSSKWLEHWQNAAAVWSYYDLAAALREDGIEADRWPASLYWAPLGADPDTFYETMTAGDSIASIAFHPNSSENSPTSASVV